MDDLFHLEIKSESLTVATFVRLREIKLSGDHFFAKYEHSIVLPDGSELLANGQPVDRSIEVAKGSTIDFNGTQVSLTDLITMAVQFAEIWRAEDDAKKVDGPPGGVVVAVPAVP